MTMLIRDLENQVMLQVNTDAVKLVETTLDWKTSHQGRQVDTEITAEVDLDPNVGIECHINILEDGIEESIEHLKIRQNANYMSIYMVMYTWFLHAN